LKERCELNQFRIATVAGDHTNRRENRQRSRPVTLGPLARPRPRRSRLRGLRWFLGCQCRRGRLRLTTRLALRSGLGLCPGLSHGPASLHPSREEPLGRAA
jgi:hypothetical protein